MCIKKKDKNGQWRGRPALPPSVAKSRRENRKGNRKRQKGFEPCRRNSDVQRLGWAKALAKKALAKKGGV